MSSYVGFIKLAYTEALKSNMKQRHGCVIIHRKNVIAYGHNYFCFHENVGDVNRNRSLHAEMAAIYSIEPRKRKKIIKQSTVVVIRLNPSGILKRSDPCCHCEEMITKIGIKRVIYSLDSDEKEIRYGKMDIVNGVWVKDETMKAIQIK